MYVRKKLILSNILILVVPMVFGMAVIGIVFRNLDRRFVGNAAALGGVEAAYEAGDRTRLEAALRVFENGGFSVRVARAEGLVYESADFGAVYARVLDGAVLGENLREYSLSTGTGRAYYYTLAGADAAHLWALTEKPGAAAAREPIDMEFRMYDAKRMMQQAVFLILGVTVLTIFVLTYMVSRSILRPLRLLREGARQIQGGNLEYSIHYPHRDEFGEVCADFEDMRRSLYTLKEEERRYEENRKELIAGITHDLNTPLTTIKGFTSGLLEGITNTPEKRKAYLENINQTADRMSRLIDELLLYFTLDMDGVRFTFRPVDLVAYFEDCILEVGDEYRVQGIELEFEADCGSAVAQIDRVHFQRAVGNVLGNSVKYRKDGVGHVRIRLWREGTWVMLAFRDDGRGIAMEEAEDIFKVFYRSDKSRNRKTGGSGLGLAIVQRIVRAHGGEVWVNRAVTEGLEIRMRLPAA